MVLSCLKSGMPQRLSWLPTNFSVPFQNPSLRWATTCLVPFDGHGDPTTSPSRIPTSSSPPPPQTQNSPTPSSNRRELVHRLRSHRRSENSKQEDMPPVPAMPPALPSQESSRDSQDKGKAVATKDKESVEFDISLAAEEIERDFIAMTGSKPPHPPKRRHGSIQEDVNAILPGMQLPKTATAERYRAPFKSDHLPWKLLLFLILLLSLCFFYYYSPLFFNDGRRL